MIEEMQKSVSTLKELFELSGDNRKKLREFGFDAEILYDKDYDKKDLNNKEKLTRIIQTNESIIKGILSTLGCSKDFQLLKGEDMYLEDLEHILNSHDIEPEFLWKNGNLVIRTVEYPFPFSFATLSQKILIHELKAREGSLLTEHASERIYKKQREKAAIPAKVNASKIQVANDNGIYELKDSKASILIYRTLCSSTKDRVDCKINEDEKLGEQFLDYLLIEELGNLSLDCLMKLTTGLAFFADEFATSSDKERDTLVESIVDTATHGDFLSQNDMAELEN